MLLGACARLVTLSPVCGAGTQSGVCITPQEIPAADSLTYVSAARQAIEVVHSDAFAARYKAYNERALRFDPFVSDDWNAASADSALVRLRRAIAGLDVTTYGGLKGWFANRVFGNRAYEGDSIGPIRINRIPAADAHDLTNTIVHEAAHRAGLTHADGDRNCGPPYILGALAEALVRGDSVVGACPSLVRPKAGPFKDRDPLAAPR